MYFFLLYFAALYQRKYQVSLNLSLVSYLFENKILLSDNILDFFQEIPLGFYLAFLSSLISIHFLKRKLIGIAIGLLGFSFCLFLLAPNETRELKNDFSVNKFSTANVDLSFLGNITKQTDVYIFLLEGVNESEFQKIQSPFSNGNYPIWKINQFFISTPHSSKSIFTLLTGILQLETSRPDLQGLSPDLFLPKKFQSWGYYTAFYSSQPLVIENLDQIAKDFFVRFEDKNSLKKRFATESEFSWGLDDEVLLSRVKEDLNIEKPIFTILSFSNTHSPYFVAKQNPFGIADNKNPYDRFQSALKYDIQIIEKIVGLIKKTRNRESLFVILSDHGESFGERNFHHHNYSLYNTEIRVPAIFLYSKEDKHQTFPSASLVDFKSSLLSLFGENLSDTNMQKNFFQQNYQIKMPLKAWNTDAYFGYIDRDIKMIFYKETNRLIKTNLDESEEEEVNDQKQKKLFLENFLKIKSFVP